MIVTDTPHVAAYVEYVDGHVSVIHQPVMVEEDGAYHCLSCAQLWPCYAAYTNASQPRAVHQRAVVTQTPACWACQFADPHKYNGWRAAGRIAAYEAIVEFIESLPPDAPVSVARLLRQVPGYQYTTYINVVRDMRMHGLLECTEWSPKRNQCHQLRVVR